MKLSPKERLRIEAELELRRRRAAEPPIWSPYVGGPQERAYNSLADVIGYGGAAGGGKTDLACGLALTAHERSIIFRREYPNLKGVIDRLHELVDGRGRWNGQDKVYRLTSGKVVELGAVQYYEDVRKYRGRPHDLIVFDEATEFEERQVRFLSGWLRTTTEGQHCRILLTFNPPTDADGQWVVAYFAPWLDDTHPNPALPGELRWFATVDGKEVERPNGEPFEHGTETITPLSRTFFPARLADNPALARTGYGAQLQSLPEPLRSQLLFGDFRAGIQEDAWQLIPTKWVKAAVERWKATSKPKDVPLTVSGVDVAHGGADKTIKADRYGDWIDTLKKWAGSQTPTGSAAAQLIVKDHDANAPLNVDAIGYGASCCERLAEQPPQGYGLKAKPINVAEGSTYRDKSRRFKMINKRAEMYWRLREALDPDNDATLCLPDDPELVADLTAPKFEIITSGIKIESKDKIKERIGRSPDCGDAVALTMFDSKPIEIIRL